MAWAGANKISKEKNSPKKENDNSIMKILKALDLKKDGRIKVQSFIDLMEKNNVNVEPSEIGEMFSLADSSGEIGINAFRIYIQNSSLWKDSLERKEISPECRGKVSKVYMISKKINSTVAAFNALDLDKDGFVEKEDFARTFNHFSHAQVDRIYEQYDADLNGKIDYEEFKTFMVKNQKKGSYRRYSSVPPPSRSSLAHH